MGALCLFSVRSPAPNLAINYASTLKVPAFCKLVNSILITLIAVSRRHGASKLVYMSLGAVIAPIFKTSRLIFSAASHQVVGIVASHWQNTRRRLITVFSRAKVSSSICKRLSPVWSQTICARDHRYRADAGEERSRICLKRCHIP